MTELVRSLSDAFSSDGEPPFRCQQMDDHGAAVAHCLPLSSRMPVIVVSALPVSLVFGQVGTDEVLALPPGHKRAYAWRRTCRYSRSLSFGLQSEAPRSEPLDLNQMPSHVDVMWANLELLPCNCGGGNATADGVEVTQKIYICLRRVSRAQCVVTALPPVLLFSYLPWEVEFSVSQGSSVVQSISTPTTLSSGQFLSSLPIEQRIRCPTVHMPTVDTRPSNGTSPDIAQASPASRLHV